MYVVTFGNDGQAASAATIKALPSTAQGPVIEISFGYAQWACENDRPENQRVKAITDPPSPSRYRVNGLVVNMPEFEHAFSCKAGQPMVSAKRCRVW